MSQDIDLDSILHVGCVVFDVFGSGFAGFKLLGHLSLFSKWVLCKVGVAFINSFSDKFIISHKNQKMSLVRIAAVALGYPHDGMFASTVLYYSSMLLLPCWNVFNKSNLAQTALDCDLQKSSNLDHTVCNVTSSVRRFHEIYISSPTSPDHWITFLHLVLSWRIANSQSRIFSHFILHLMNLEWRASPMVQSIFGPST